MPTRPRLPCTHMSSGCRHLQPCPVHGRRPSGRAAGYNSEWERLSKNYLSMHTRCVDCDERAQVVDHIEPHRGNQVLFWSRSNWQPMCKSCHSKKTASQDGGFGNARIG
jgi:5-methylcytosine-specific restriction protein A